NSKFTQLRTLIVSLSAPTGGAKIGTESSAELYLSAARRVSDDFDGDGIADPTAFRLKTTEFLISGSSIGFFIPAPKFGAPGLSDIPVPGDYDNTGRAEPAVFRPSTGQWFVLGPNGGHQLTQFGDTNLRDIPVSGDFDGVGYTEQAVFRPAT